MKKLSTSEYWNNATQNAKIQLKEDDPIRKWLNSYMNNFQGIRNCIEVGCYPGRFLTIFGDKDVTLNGIDYVDNLNEVENNLKNLNYKTGKFINADITEFKSDEKFDCVMSFGLIEHFVNWDEIFQKHIDLVEKNGYIIIEVPNFNGWWQRIPRRIFDTTNYRRHNIKSMNLKKWIKILRKNNFTIITAEYFGGYDLWFEKEDLTKRQLRIKEKFLKILQYSKNLIFKKKESKHFSNYIGVIAKRNS